MATMKDMVEGLQILIKYDSKGDCAAEHDQLWAGSTPPMEIEKPDLQRLDDLGWFWDKDCTSWSRFT